MTTDSKTRAEINRQNAQKSTGPKTDAGKAASRRNALKHGLAATTIESVDTPGEPAGAFQARLDAWVADTQPRNVLELAMIQRACRASWKLDRCARYEDAAAAVREARGVAPDPDQPTLRMEAHDLGNLLMFTLNLRDDDGTPNTEPDRFDDAPRDADALARFKEGVEWLLDAWDGVLPYLPADGSPPSEGSDEFRRRIRLRALRLLGVPTGHPAPAQPLRAAGEAEVRRLRALHANYSTPAAGRLEADLSLFSAGPEAQLLMRYEAQAERELHRAVNTFLKLRKDPDLVPPPEPEAADAAAPPETAEGEPAPPHASPAPNEPSPPGRPRRFAVHPTTQEATREPRIASP